MSDARSSQEVAPRARMTPLLLSATFDGTRTQRFGTGIRG
jgi:hypothetical protein